MIWKWVEFHMKEGFLGKIFPANISGMNFKAWLGQAPRFQDLEDNFKVMIEVFVLLLWPNLLTTISDIK